MSVRSTNVSVRRGPVFLERARAICKMLRPFHCDMVAGPLWRLVWLRKILKLSNSDLTQVIWTVALFVSASSCLQLLNNSSNNNPYASSLPECSKLCALGLLVTGRQLGGVTPSQARLELKCHLYPSSHNLYLQGYTE